MKETKKMPKYLDTPTPYSNPKGKIWLHLPKKKRNKSSLPEPSKRIAKEACRVSKIIELWTPKFEVT